MNPETSKQPRYERAVVIGASMAGLAVGRALSDHFREVVLVERDALALDKPAHRAGVGQSWHLHGLTIGGQREFEALFPGFGEAAVKLGALRIDDGCDIAGFGKYGWHERGETEYICLSATRMLLEFVQRQRFFALVKNARLLSETKVMDLIIEADGGRPRVAGVRTDRADEPEIRADLVVDCSGRKMSWKRWFKEHGIALPRETVVDSDCAYSSRFYRPRNPAEFSWTAMVVDPAFPERPSWGVIVPLEGNDWIVTLGGFNGNYPPVDDRGFMEFARALPTPALAHALERADPLTKVRAFRKLEMRWNHFNSYDGPSRFLAVGDSAWAYNPLYGQGMSVAAGCARILRDVLAPDDDLDTLPRRYYGAARKFALPLWDSTAQLDMRWPGTTGKRPWYSKFSLPLGDLILRAAARDRAIFEATMQVVHLIETPTGAVFKPSFMGRLLRYGLKELFGGAPQLRTQMQLPPPGHVSPHSHGRTACCACSQHPCHCTLPRNPGAQQRSSAAGQERSSLPREG
jgi:flavin-dependent dehydrogenase